MTADLLAALATRGGSAPSFASWHGKEALFIALSVVAAGSALLVVTVRNVVHAALWLVVTLGALAGCYLLLTAEFVAWVQVLIYIGAVVVMLLFATMLTRAPIGRVADLDSGNRAVAAVVGLATAVLLVLLVVDGFAGAYVDVSAVAGRGAGTAAADGGAVFRQWVLPFEVVSVLLLAALIGAIVLVRRPDEDQDEDAVPPGAAATAIEPGAVPSPTSGVTTEPAARR